MQGGFWLPCTLTMDLAAIQGLFGIGVQRVPNEVSYGFATKAMRSLDPPVWCNWTPWPGIVADQPHLPHAWSTNNAEHVTAVRQQMQNGEPGDCAALSNEPELFGQANDDPESVANFTRHWPYPWIGPNINIADAGAYDWLSWYLDLGGAIPNLWGVHNYAWTPGKWYEQFDKFQSFIEDKKVVRPIVVTECACWWATPIRQIILMDAISQLIASGDVYAAFWFSVYRQDGWEASNLVNASGELTEIGQHYVAAANLDKTTYLPNVGRNA